MISGIRQIVFLAFERSIDSSKEPRYRALVFCHLSGFIELRNTIEIQLLRQFISNNFYDHFVYCLIFVCHIVITSYVLADLFHITLLFFYTIIHEIFIIHKKPLSHTLPIL